MRKFILLGTTAAAILAAVGLSVLTLHADAHEAPMAGLTDALVDLAAGKATLTLVADKQPEPPARQQLPAQLGRQADLVMAEAHRLESPGEASAPVGRYKGPPVKRPRRLRLPRPRLPRRR